MNFDVRQTPFSRCGSYLSLSRTPPHWKRAPEPGAPLYLRGHFARGVGQRDIFRVDVYEGGGEPVACAAKGAADALTLRAPGGGEAEFLFAAPDTVRVRGRGLRLRFVALPGNEVAYPAEGGRWVVNGRASLARFLFERLSGELIPDAPWGENRCDHVAIALAPGADGRFEAALDTFQSTWLPRARPAWDAARDEVRREFGAWLAALPPAPAELRDAREHAAYVNWSCVVAPSGLLRRRGMLMSKFAMDQVWSWDNCFNAMATVRAWPELAFEQVQLEFDHQDEFGAFPDGLNPLFRHYNYCKPPVYGWALGYMARQRPGFFTPARLRELYGPLVRLTQWWFEHRTVRGQTLPYYLHGNDSGWDNSTMFDFGAPLVAPDLAALLVLQTEFLAEVAERLGLEREAARWRATRQALLDALLNELWRGEQFVARLALTGKEVSTQSLIPCVTLALGPRLPPGVRQALIARVRGFHTPHGLATERTDSPHYQPDGYWRGPIWAPPTYLIVHGLRELGERDLAREIARRFCATCARRGFAENFDALTGAGLRDPAYTWTSSVFLLLAGELCEP